MYAIYVCHVFQSGIGIRGTSAHLRRSLTRGCVWSSPLIKIELAVSQMGIFCIPLTSVYPAIS